MKEKRSVSSLVLENVMKFSGAKRRMSSKKLAKKNIQKALKRNSKPYKFPKLIRKKAKITKEICDGMDYYIVNNKENAKNIILYMHGGCYVDQPLYFHWKFIEQVALNTGYTIYVPIYPKAPNCTYVECYKKVLSLYLEIIDGKDNGFDDENQLQNESNNQVASEIENDDKNIVFMGDSAGGGFVIAFAQYLRNSGIKKNASNIIMLSPWLDMSLTNPELEEVEKVDPSLSTVGIVEMAKTWAGGSSFDNYMLSPIKGEFKGLGKMTIFVGTHELLLPDARQLKAKLAKENIPLNYFEYKYMNHVFPLFPIIPEAKEAKKIIYQILIDAKKE